MNKALIRKYNVPGPRYTSYPTVLYWDESTTFDLDQWKSRVLETFSATNGEEGISLYLHLPFCEKLCHYCGCNKRITRQHNVEKPYLDRLLKEWEMYVALFDEKPRIAELHLGGGTPTFFSAAHLKELMTGILSHTEPVQDAEFSFEAHPSSTTFDKLSVLHQCGFRRLSLGIQDFDEKVQHATNRFQSIEEVAEVCDNARHLGYTSINFDLIYGLPKQTLESIEDTIKATIALKPDRIAYYSYAHVPWVSKAQRLFTEADLPSNENKRSLYELGKERLLDAGYVEIGMDHFALPDEALTKAMDAQQMHRNFMGYTTSNTKLMIGLGVSAIGDTWHAFGQNVKALQEYERKVDQGEFPLYRGHFLSQEDLVIRKHILNLMCQFETFWTPEEMSVVDFEDIIARLSELIADGLCTPVPQGLKVTPLGRVFIRNICMAFDVRMFRNQPTKAVFSQTI